LRRSTLKCISYEFVSLSLLFICILLKKVLILAYDFPPYISVGALRPKSWYDYFYEFDIEPTVITRQWNNKHKNALDYVEASDSRFTQIEISDKGKIIRSVYSPNLSNRLLIKYGYSRFRLIRKLITAYYEFFQFIFTIGPKAEIFKEAKKYLSENQVDCIIATGDPFILFHYAAKLSSKHNVPWIADYRDAWSTIFERQNKPIQKAWNKFFEKKTVPLATGIVTVSEFIKRNIESVVAHDNFLILPNGYDPLSIAQANCTSQKNDILRIAMIGSILPWNPIDHFLKTISEYISDKKFVRVEFIFFGCNQSESISEKIKSEFPNIVLITKFISKLPNAILLEKVSECNALLLFNYYSFMGTKIFEYIGLKRKIILCFTNDNQANQLKQITFPISELEDQSNQLQADLIAETNSGIAVKDADDLKTVLTDLWEEFSATGQIECHSINVENYSRKIQTEKLANLIKSIC